MKNAAPFGAAFWNSNRFRVWSLPRLRRRARKETFTLRALAGELAGAADSFRTFTRTLFRRLFVVIATLHFAESAFPLHLLFERLQRLIDVVIADENLYQDPSPVTEYQTQQAVCAGCATAPF